MADASSGIAHQTIDDSDVRPGDRVTILLHSDMWTRTSFVHEDGFYVGCGAVEQGRAHIVAIHRWRKP